jgi:hypothetical protein
MIKIFSSRASSLGLIAIGCLTLIALVKGVDTSSPIAAICMGLAASHAHENKGKNEPKA